MSKSPLYRSIFVWYRGLRKLDRLGVQAIHTAWLMWRVERMEKRRLGHVIG